MRDEDHVCEIPSCTTKVVDLDDFREFYFGPYRTNYCLRHLRATLATLKVLWLHARLRLVLTVIIAAIAVAGLVFTTAWPLWVGMLVLAGVIASSQAKWVLFYYYDGGLREFLLTLWGLAGLASLGGIDAWLILIGGWEVGIPLIPLNTMLGFVAGLLLVNFAHHPRPLFHPYRPPVVRPFAEVMRWMMDAREQQFQLMVESQRRLRERMDLWLPQQG